MEAPKKLGPKSLVKIGSVRSEILLIWTNVPRRNIAWTNVTVTTKICSRCPNNLLLKFGQNRVSNSWDIRWGFLFLLLLLLLGKVKPTLSSTGTELQTGTELCNKMSSKIKATPKIRSTTKNPWVFKIFLWVPRLVYSDNVTIITPSIPTMKSQVSPSRTVLTQVLSSYGNTTLVTLITQGHPRLAW